MLLSAEILSQVLTALTDRVAIEITIRIEPTSKPTNGKTGLRTGVGGDVEVGHEVRESHKLLTGAGLNGDVVETLAREFPPERIRQCIVGAKRQQGVRNFPAYVVQALRSNYYRNIVVEEKDVSINKS